MIALLGLLIPNENFHFQCHLFLEMHSNIYFRSTYLAGLVRQARGKKSLREIGNLINVSAATMSRIENGSQNIDMTTLLSVCSWLKISPGILFANAPIAPTTQNLEDEITSLILRDKRLDPQVAYALTRIIEATYRVLIDD